MTEVKKYRADGEALHKAASTRSRRTLAKAIEDPRHQVADWPARMAPPRGAALFLGRYFVHASPATCVPTSALIAARRLEAGTRAAKAQAGPPAQGGGHRRTRPMPPNWRADGRGVVRRARHRARSLPARGWAHIEAGRSGLLHATPAPARPYAVYFGLLDRALAGKLVAADCGCVDHADARAGRAGHGARPAAPLAGLGLHWQVGVRTGDTAAGERARQARQLPTSWSSTPESLSLLRASRRLPPVVCRAGAGVVDEWHEMSAASAACMVQLALSRLRRFVPRPARLWG